MLNRTFTNEEESLQFYDDRYSQGYMEDWDPKKKIRVLQLIKELNLPATGKALDFGCGNGVFTEVIRTALPQWQVYGCDVSEIAVDKASKRFPHLTFFFHDGSSETDNQFDLILTHHVFEHVYDLSKAWNELAQFGNSNSIVIHILPCGNKNSFEYNHCLLFKNGIDKNTNRFFFEDVGHLRRMTTEDMEMFAKQNNYHLFKDYYANQYYGAIDWISNSGNAFIEEFTDVKDAVDDNARNKIRKIRKKIYALVQSKHYSNQSIKQEVKQFLKGSLKSFRYIFLQVYSRLLVRYYDTKVQTEWKYNRHRKNGSEMYLFFRKKNSTE